MVSSFALQSNVSFLYSVCGWNECHSVKILTTLQRLNCLPTILLLQPLRWSTAEASDIRSPLLFWYHNDRRSSMNDKPLTMVVGMIFSGGGEYWIFPDVAKKIYPTGAKSSWILFLPIEITFFVKNVTGKCQVSKSRGDLAPWAPSDTHASDVRESHHCAVYMALFIVAKLRFCFNRFFSCWVILQIVVFGGPACEVVQNSKATMDWGWCAGECEVVANDSHNFRMATIEKATVTKCHVNAVYVGYVTNQLESISLNSINYGGAFCNRNLTS